MRFFTIKKFISAVFILIFSVLVYAVVIFSDDFNRANGSPGANWTGYFSTWLIVSNQLVGDATSDNQIEYNGSQLANAKISFKAVSTITNPGGITARRASGTDTYYIWRIYANGGWELCRKVSGSLSVVLNDGGTTLTLVSGAVVELTVTGTGATVTLAMKYNGVAVTSYSDTDASRITVAGYTGIYNFGSVASVFDDFSLDDTTIASSSNNFTLLGIGK